MNIRKQLAGIALALVLMTSVMPGTASASEVDLGSPATLEQLLDSPEYRIWHADVLRLYQAFFNRTPDTGGAAYWIDKYEDGSSLDDLAWGFSNSIEFQNQYGSTLSNSDFLTIVYSNVLGRVPDQDGFNYWLGQMNNGLTQHGVVRWVVANDEFIDEYPFTGTASNLYRYLLDIRETTGVSGEIDLEDEIGPRPVNDYDGCNAARIWPKNSKLVAFETDAGGLLYEIAYEFSTTAGAEAFMSKTRQIEANCNPYYGYTVSEIAVSDLGDDAVAHHFVDQENRSGTSHWKQVVIRIDRLVLYVVVVEELPVSADTVFDFATQATIQATGSTS